MKLTNAISKLSLVFVGVFVMFQGACGAGGSSSLTTASQQCGGLNQADCSSRSGCLYLGDRCYQTSELNKDCAEIVDKYDCELVGFARESCRFFMGNCKPLSAFDNRGFDTVSKMHRDTEDRFDLQGFDISGYRSNGTKFDVRGFDVDGKHSNGTRFDARGFDVDGKHSNGTRFDARGFDVDEKHSNGTRFDARGFNVNGRQANNSIYDAHGFNLNGTHSNNTDHDDNGFNLNGIHQVSGTNYSPLGFDQDNNEGPRDQFGFVRRYYRDGSLRDPLGFDYQGLLADGGTRTDRGFNRDGSYLTTGNNRDDRGFDAYGNLANGERFDGRGFDFNGVHRSGRRINDEYVDDYGFNLLGYYLVANRPEEVRERDDRGFDYRGFFQGVENNRLDNNGHDRDGNNAQGFDTSGYNRQGMDAQGFNRQGFNALGFHKTTHTQFNPSGFDIDGFNAAGMNSENKHRSQLREERVGAACYLPGGDDYLSRENLRAKITRWPQPYGSVEEFANAIENKCLEYTGDLLIGTQTLAEKRNDLIRAIKRNMEFAGPGERRYYQVRENSLKDYLTIINTQTSKFRPVASVTFLDEDGIDAGGLRREFKELVAQGLTPLFKQDGGRANLNLDWPVGSFTDFASCTVSPQTADVNNCYKNAGAVFAKLAFYDEQGVPQVQLSYFTLNKLLGKEIQSTLDYLAILLADKRETFNSAVLNVLKMTDEELGALTFADITDNDDDDERAVTPDNIWDYFKLMVEYQVNRPAAVEAMNNFIVGFNSIVSKNGHSAVTLSGINANQLALILEGLPVSAANLISQVIFEGRNADQQKEWFAEFLPELVEEDPQFIGKLLRFGTGSSGLMGGRDLKFNVRLLGANSLPEGHTCFYSIYTANYATKEDFKNKLKQAVNESSGFELR